VDILKQLQADSRACGWELLISRGLLTYKARMGGQNRNESKKNPK